MNITATTRNVRMSPKKVREVTRQIAGLPVSKAQAVLANIPRKSARLVAQTLKSAVANAEHISAEWNEGEIQNKVAEIKETIQNKTTEKGTLARKYRHLRADLAKYEAYLDSDNKLAADTRRDSWLELRRGPLIELTTQWRVRTPTPAARNAASMTSIKTVGGEEALVLFGGGVYPNTYYNDTHILRLEDLPAASAAPEKPPQSLANLCQAAVAREISDDNVFEMLMFADDRQLADLRAAIAASLEFATSSTSWS